MGIKSTTINRDVQLLSPWFAIKVKAALARCHELGYPVEAFEGWRGPARQDYLYTQGRTVPGKIVTKAKAWESYHQYGLACDLALLISNRWSWDFDTAKVSAVFLEQGLEWLAPFETGHFQMTGGVSIKDAKAITQKYGLQQLWLEVKEKSK